MAVLGATAGVLLGSLGSLSRRLVPFGGGALLGVAIFWILPEMSEFFQWQGAALWIAGGALILAGIDRYVYPVCPACSPEHNHAHCSTRLHGFATPLLLAAGMHAALDGWSAASTADDARLSAGLIAGLMAHKLPEGLALGMIARASMKSPQIALFWSVVAQLATLFGAALESMFAPYLGPAALHAILALVGGSFLYLGYHAIHGELRRSGFSPALVPALTGVAGSSVLRLFIR